MTDNEHRSNEYVAVDALLSDAMCVFQTLDDGRSWSVVYLCDEQAIPKPAAPGPGLCERVLVGRGTDTWDPLCGRLKGHEGPCE